MTKVENDSVANEDCVVPSLEGGTQKQTGDLRRLVWKESSSSLEGTKDEGRGGDREASC